MMKILRILFLFLFTIYCLLTLFTGNVLAQVNWGPDVRLTYYTNGTAYGPRIVAIQDTLHVVWYEDWRDTMFKTEVMYKRSTDCGLTWTPDTSLSPILPGRSFWPVIAVNGRVIHIAWNEDAGDSIVYVRSTDSGRSWSFPKTITQAGFVFDIGVSGDIVLIDWYTTTAIYLSVSTDAGVSWQILRRRRVSNEDRLAVNWPFIHIVTELDTAIPPIPEIYHERSSDGGQTWSQLEMVSERDLFGGQNSDICLDQLGNPHVVWYDYKYSPYGWTGDIFYRSSQDTGRTWLLIDSLTTEHRATNSSIVAQGENMHLVWQDERFNPSKRYSEIYYRFSSNRGMTWAPEIRLTYDSLDSRSPRLAVSPSGVYLGWADNRGDGRGFEIYFKRGVYSSGVEIERREFASKVDFRIFPTPSKGVVIFRSTFSKLESFSLDIFDVLGRRIKGYRGFGRDIEIVWDGRDEEGKHVRSGVYFVLLRAGEKSHQKKVIIVRREKP